MRAFLASCTLLAIVNSAMMVRLGEAGVPHTLLDLSVFNQTVRLGKVAATVNVIPISRNGAPGLNFTFHSLGSSVYPVGCLSVYEDIRYELLDQTGHLVPIDQDVLRHPPYSGPSVISHAPANMTGRRPTCDSPIVHEWFGFTSVALLYPHLAPGKYVLQMTFAPRHLVQQARFSPVQITITAS